MLRAVLLACGLVFSSVAQACQCAYQPLDTDAARGAKNIFIFRLVQAEVMPSASSEGHAARVLGRIDIVGHLRGNTASFKEIEYSTDHCCGSRFDVGSYFVAFVSKAGPRLVANNGNVMELGQQRVTPQTRAEILTILKGEKTLEDVFSRAELERTEQSPVMPPCPRPHPAGAAPSASQSE